MTFKGTGSYFVRDVWIESKIVERKGCFVSRLFMAPELKL